MSSKRRIRRKSCKGKRRYDCMQAAHVACARLLRAQPAGTHMSAYHSASVAASISGTRQAAIRCADVPTTSRLGRTTRRETMSTAVSTVRPQCRVQELPALKAPFFGGQFGGITTLATGENVAVAVLGESSEDLSWKDYMAWVKSLDDAVPLTRPIGAMLYATMEGEFKDQAYWTGEESRGSFASYQLFTSGNQSFNRKSERLGGRAVRRIPA